MINLQNQLRKVVYMKTILYIMNKLRLYVLYSRNERAIITATH
jgi:hypothetical protein